MGKPALRKLYPHMIPQPRMFFIIKSHLIYYV